VEPSKSTGDVVLDIDVLRKTAGVLATPIGEMAPNLSRLLANFVPHSAMMLLAVDDVGHPRKVHGDSFISEHVTFAELEAIRSDLRQGGMVRADFQVSGATRPVVAVVARTGALLVLTDPGSANGDDVVAVLWEIVASRMHQRANEAAPSYLMESRAAASVRAEAVTELADRQSTTLEALLAVLRSSTLEDRAARQAATNLATEATIHLSTATDRVLTFTEEPVTTAFERLRDDLRPLVRYRDIDVQFVEPPVDGRALPSEVAHGARAVVRGAVLALVDQPEVGRVRVQWDCDGKNLLINVRDDGPGDLTIDSPQLQPLRQRVIALNGQISLAATAGWGSEMSVVMPLDPPHVRQEDSRLSTLSPREREVVAHVVAGLRNRDTARRLGISENTVKFHLAGIFRKLGVVSRSELASLVLQPGERIVLPATVDAAGGN
jgi:DNA-binding CsgD family transcriptional regulator